MPVPYGEMLVGSRRISQDISTRDEGGGRNGRGCRATGIKHKKNPAVIAELRGQTNEDQC